MSLVVYILAAFGFAYGAGHSRPTRWIREKLYRKVPIVVELIECPACMGFWTGFAANALGWFPTIPDKGPSWLYAGCLTMATNYLLSFYARLANANADVLEYFDDRKDPYA